MLVLLKSILPVVIYALCFAASFMAIFGKVRFASGILVVLLPLRNVTVRLWDLPFGRDVTDILILSLAVGCLVLFGKREYQRGNSSALLTLFLLLAAYTFFSLRIGYTNFPEEKVFNFYDSRLQEWKNFITLPFMALIFFFSVRDRGSASMVLLCMAAAFVLVDYYAVAQIADFSNLASREKIKGTFVWLGPNEVAAFYSQYTILLMGIWFFLKRAYLKIILFVLIIFNIYCILFLFSRGAYLGLAVGLFMLFALKKRALLIPLTLVIIFWQTALPEKVRERIDQTHGEFGELDVSAQSRLEIWEEALRMFSDSPVFGNGLGSFRYQGFSFGDTHNIYLRILSEQGIIVFLLFCAIIIFFLTEGWRLYKTAKDPPFQGLGLGFCCCVVVLLVNNFFGDRWTHIEVSSYLWIIAGVVARLNILEHERIIKRVR